MKEDITITVTDQEGTKHTLICPLDMGLSLKDICKAYELPMEAMCGGMAMCATCHCFILSETITLPEKSDIEDALLSELFNTQATSRLACQIYLTAQMDGLAVEIPAD
ncbi:2Fe-2S iron-sulfur cluster-binding protein [Chryseobacterium indologenes]|uniref:Ferredoxin n=1 Tax=Chryseobacterium indologenes TaxID=253 RepID=A0AAD1DTV2_CHRID|nr:2Fe-2S iron-sulfur cluster-binding protein [Chryseobacterium indologenes]AZB16454.1 ferredoxin [Chryseobacterium indologenes]MBF6644960.1 2Fe-2S iron-sulfur cluster binding domain-containing protein [Chryseobacterium indologenes]MBU3048415.1 2Fe-2S iron-sulfur cluster binding domain-containing protein [Chryseobacterium indologenes]QQQ71359.1 2Fe-2S iron-sulfur cluster binding domain-containing protein [Chryseobacterium indologenes]